METSKQSASRNPFAGYVDIMGDAFSSPRNAAMLFLGASAGLPIMLVYQVLSIWLRDSDVSRVQIPGFSKWLGNRRGWTLFAIFGTALAMFAMSQQDPKADLQAVAVCAVLIAFASATLDICVDAWRVDNAENKEQAMVSAIYQLGYRFGMIAAVTGGLFIADIGGFGLTYLLLGILAVLGASTPLWAPDVSKPLQAGINPILGFLLGTLTLGGAIYHVPILGDFADIVRRTGPWAMLIMAMVVSYRISDTTMGVMAGPLYIDLGYDKSTIGAVKGAFGITVLIVGAFLGGLIATRDGLARAMIIGAVLTVITNLAFAWLAQVETPHAAYLFVTIGADNIAAGFAGSVFIAFMSVMTNKKMSATQYALLSSLFAFYGKSLAGFSGVLADKVGYEAFFVITAMFGIPAFVLAIWAAKSRFTDGIDDSGVPAWGPFIPFQKH